MNNLKLAAGFVAILSMTACSTTTPRPPPVLGQSVEEAGAAHGTRGEPPLLGLALLNDGHRVALYSHIGAMLVFEDDRYIGYVNRSVALQFSVCLAQPNGRALLTERLRKLSAGDADPLAELAPDGKTQMGELQCPPLVDETPKIDDSKKSGLGPAGTAAAILASPVLIPLAILTWFVVEEVDGLLPQNPSEGNQTKLELGMAEIEVAKLMGKPTAMFRLEPAHTEVHYFWGTRGQLWIGLDDDRLVWLIYTGLNVEWLSAATDREKQRKAAEASSRTKQ